MTNNLPAALLDYAAAFAQYEIEADEFYALTAEFSAQQVADALGIPAATIEHYRKTQARRERISAVAQGRIKVAMPAYDWSL